MSITVDNTATVFTPGAGAFQTSPVSWPTAFAIAAGTTNLIVTLTLAGVTPPAVSLSYDSSGTPQVMQQLATVTNTNSNLYIFGLANPHSGTLDFSLSWTGGNNQRVTLEAISFFGGSNTGIQATDFPHNNSATGNSTTPTVTLTTASGNMVFGLFIDDGNNNNHCIPDQTPIYNSVVGRVNAANRATASSSSQIMSAVLDVGASTWSALSVDLSLPITTTILQSQICM